MPDIQIVVRFSDDNFQIQMIVERKLIFLSIVELHSSLTITHLTVGVIQRRLFMMSLIHQAFMTTEFTLVVVSSNWKSGKFIIIVVQTSYSLTDDSYLSLRHLSVISVTRIVLPQQILFYTRNVFIYVCLYSFVILLILPFLFTYAHHQISWRPGNSNFFNLILFLKLFWLCHFVIWLM